MRLQVCIPFALLFFVSCQPAIAQAGNNAPSGQKIDISAIRVAAEKGDATAQFHLGSLYYFGQRVSRDYARAAFWYRKAAEQGDAVAEQTLGGLYYNGQGVPQNYVQAVHWVRKAALQGDAGAQWDLGLAYQKGEGVPQSNSEAYFWLDIAASSENGDILQQMVSKSRDEAASHLAAADLSRVQERAAKWVAGHSAKTDTH